MHMHLKQKQQQYMQAAVQAPPPRVRATLRPYCRQTHQAPKQHPKTSSWLSEGGGGMAERLRRAAEGGKAGGGMQGLGRPWTRLHLLGPFAWHRPPAPSQRRSCKRSSSSIPS